MATGDLALAAAAPVERTFRSYTIDELLRLPQPEWLVEDFLVEGSIAMVYGASGTGKTFVACDLALSIATGQFWHARYVKASKVLYVAAEGGRGLAKRLVAWMDEHGDKDNEYLRVLPAGVQVIDDVEYFLREIRDFDPDVIILDPFVECFVGRDENFQRDVGRFVHALRRIQRSRPERPITIVVLHHTGWETRHERGSTVLRAAVDTIVRVKRMDQLVAVKVEKQRDFDRAVEEVVLDSVPVETERAGTQFNSIVLRAVSRTQTGYGPSAWLTPRLLKTLRALAECGGQSVRSGAWEKAAGAGANHTFHNHRKRLVDRQCVARVKSGVYRLTEEGQKVLEAATAK